MLLLLQNHSTSKHLQYQHTLLHGMEWLLIRFKSMLVQPVKFNSQNYYFSFLLGFTLDHEFIRTCSTQRVEKLISALECECGFICFTLPLSLFTFPSRIRSVYALLFWKEIASCRNSFFSRRNELRTKSWLLKWNFVSWFSSSLNTS